MKAYLTFINELNKLSAFYKATLYSYEQTEELLNYKKINKIKYDEPTESGLIIKKPDYFKVKKSSKIEIRKNLSELIFVRLVSALEIFFIDLIKDVFLVNKEPFKRQDIVPSFTQAELLSIHSMAEVYNKIINKECRKLSSGGFIDIVKFYRKYFDIDMGNFSPGLSKMEEYHDRRHLLVHRLGNTDQSFRDKYNCTKHSISVDNDYLLMCFKDFKGFSEMVKTQVKYQIDTTYNKKSRRSKTIERKVKINFEFSDEDRPKFLEPDFEFWADDEFMVLNDLLDEKKDYDNKCELTISGKLRQVKMYMRYIHKLQKKKRKNVKIEILNEQILNENSDSFSTRVLDEDLLEKIRIKLPVQPWPTGIHKIIASDLNISNKLVSIAIQQLISKGIFKNQVNGVIVENDNVDNDIK